MVGQERVAEGAITILPKRASVDGKSVCVCVCEENGYNDSVFFYVLQHQQLNRDLLKEL